MVRTGVLDRARVRGRGVRRGPNVMHGVSGYLSSSFVDVLSGRRESLWDLPSLPTRCLWSS